jgi:hypothetical protein
MPTEADLAAARERKIQTGTAGWAAFAKPAGESFL